MNQSIRILCRSCAHSASFLWLRGRTLLALLLFAGIASAVAVHAQAADQSDAAAGDHSVLDSYRPPQADVVLRTLKQEHPRLLITPDRIAEIKQLVAQNPIAARIQQSILANADRALGEAPTFYELRDGRRLLYVSNDILGRVMALSFAHLLTGRKDYVERAWAELDTAAKFKDWNPAHFLDVAVMTNAFAIGYDWLYSEWTPEQRATLRAAIVEKGLGPAMKVYTGNPVGMGWHKAENNWNQVCNGGIGLGALAIADEEPELASQILAHALDSIPVPMCIYEPDGAGREGVSYWDFGSRYNVLLMASLESALGTDFGLSQIDGFRKSGDYAIYLSGTGGMSFDFGDCSLGRVSTPQHLWMGRHYDIPRYGWFRETALASGQAGNVYDLLWLDNDVNPFDIRKMPLDRLFREVEVASMRDSWIDGEGFIVALQGGGNRWSHRHQDLGSFILEADGVRWIMDSGKEGQTYQRHVNKIPREDFYRVRAEGHNTLVFDPDRNAAQKLDGMAVFTAFDSQPERAHAVLDLNRAYDKNTRQITREFDLVRGREFTVTDKIVCTKPSEIWSYFHTKADVALEPDGRSATLTQDGKSLKVTLASPPGAVFTVLPAAPGPQSPNPSKQSSNAGRRKLAIHLEGVESTIIEVRFEREATLQGNQDSQL